MYMEICDHMKTWKKWKPPEKCVNQQGTDCSIRIYSMTSSWWGSSGITFQRKRVESRPSCTQWHHAAPSMGCDGVGVFKHAGGSESSGDLFPQRRVGLWKIVFLLFLVASNIWVFYNKHLLLSNKKNPYFLRKEKITTTDPSGHL